MGPDLAGLKSRIRCGRPEFHFWPCLWSAHAAVFQPPDVCSGGFLQPGVPFRASLYLHVVNSHISFQIFFAKCFLGVLQAGKARCVCVSVCITAHNKRITEFFFLIFKRFCYIFNPSGIHFNFGVGKKSNIIFLIASCPHTIITYQLIYSWICFWVVSIRLSVCSCASSTIL